MNSNCAIDTNVENTMNISDTTVFNFETHNIENLPDVLKKYKVPELKKIAQKNRLHVSGTKPILISRITTHYEKYRCATIIQKIVRGWFARLWMRVRGCATATPINDADFYSFEPISEIPYKYYFSYKTGTNVYGFRVQSFIHLIYKCMIDCGGSSMAVLNPYNREPIPDKTIFDVFRFVRLYNILFGSGSELLEDGCENMRDIIYSKPRGTNFMATIQGAIVKQNINKKLDEMRTKPILQRVINLFMDIDLLGNYTSYTWFSNLTVHNTIVYWGVLYDIWLYRAGILTETKKRICPFYDPFHRKILSNPTSIEEVIDHCLYAMENMVYMSPEEEYRKLGAMYVLCALTFVSGEARRALPWLADIVGW